MSRSVVCVDANLVVRLVVAPTDEAINRLWGGWRARNQPVAAPTLLHYEVTNALYRYQRAGTYSPAAIRFMMQAAMALPIQLQGDPALHSSALEIAGRFALPAAYDAHYLALAERLGAELWTADARLANTVRPTPSWVRLLGEQADADDAR